MPQTLTGSPTFSPAITAPQDGDPRTAASVAAPMQTLIDNDVALATLVSNGAGVRRLQTFASQSDMRHAPAADGDVAILNYDSIDACGIYRYRAASTAAHDGVAIISSQVYSGGTWVEKPAGRWITLIKNILGIGHGAAALDATGNISYLNFSPATSIRDNDLDGIKLVDASVANTKLANSRYAAADVPNWVCDTGTATSTFVNAATISGFVATGNRLIDVRLFGRIGGAGLPGITVMGGALLRVRLTSGSTTIDSAPVYFSSGGLNAITFPASSFNLPVEVAAGTWTITIQGARTGEVASEVIHVNDCRMLVHEV